MKYQDSKRRRLRAGFSLLEMVIVLGIIAVIIGGAITVMGKVGSGADRQRVRQDFNSVGAALRMYKVANGRYPTTQQGIDALVNKPTTTPPARDWTQLMDRVPVDPWQNEYGYKFPGSVDSSLFEIISKGPDGIEGNEDDISSQQTE
ncbi:MAG: type II secretion system major pseudopilin GspG [Verrucomicrobiota bacterium]